MDLDLFDHAIEYFEKYDPDYKFNRKPVYTFLEENDHSVCNPWRQRDGRNCRNDPQSQTAG